MFFSKKREFIFIVSSVITIFVCFIWVRGYSPFSEGTDDYFHMYVNDVKIGDFSSQGEAEALLLEARRNVAAEYAGMAFMEVEARIESEPCRTGCSHNPSAGKLH